jgi:hypothetical protein
MVSKSCYLLAGRSSLQGRLLDNLMSANKIAGRTLEA